MTERWFGWRHWYHRVRGTQCIAESGERTLRAGTIFLGNARRHIILPIDECGITPYSLHELEHGAILCRTCRCIILFGEIIDLERYEKPAPNSFVSHDERTHLSVICERCSDAIALYHIWVPDAETGKGRVSPINPFNNHVTQTA